MLLKWLFARETQIKLRLKDFYYIQIMNCSLNVSPPFQYIHPTDSHKLGQAELVCIDEAAAIPLPLVKSLLGPYLVFMSSTING